MFELYRAMVLTAGYERYLARARRIGNRRPFGKRAWLNRPETAQFLHVWLS